jgi:hypothetical protein
MFLTLFSQQHQRRIRQQELMKLLVSESILPKLELDISDNNIPRVVEKIADWMESTGGLWME